MGCIPSSPKVTGVLVSKNDRYTFREKIGRGGYGTVFKATDNKTKETVAIKLMQFGMKLSQEDVLREVTILQQLKHRNVVEYKDRLKHQVCFLIPRGEVALVMEYCSNGTLRDLLSKVSPASFTCRIKWYKQLLCGLAYIHSKFIIHRDIKPANILVDHNEVLKISDVGLAKVLGSKEEMKWSILTSYKVAIVGSLPFLAPEVYKFNYNPKNDIFSMGLVMFVICELPLKFRPRVISGLLEKNIQRHALRAIQNSGLGYYYYSTRDRCEAAKLLGACKCTDMERRIFNWMLQEAHENRPEASQVLDRVIKFEKLHKQELKK